MQQLAEKYPELFDEIQKSNNSPCPPKIQGKCGQNREPRMQKECICKLKSCCEEVSLIYDVIFKIGNNTSMYLFLEIQSQSMSEACVEIKVCQRTLWSFAKKFWPMARKTRKLS
jgi:hypothetical protein